MCHSLSLRVCFPLVFDGLSSLKVGLAFIRCRRAAIQRKIRDLVLVIHKSRTFVSAPAYYVSVTPVIDKCSPLKGEREKKVFDSSN